MILKNRYFTLRKFYIIFGIYIVLSLESEAIMGGEKSHVEDYPYLVSVQRNKRHICGGGILDKNFVVTAAHCVAKPNGCFVGGTLQVVAGIDDLFSDSPSRQARNVTAAYVPKHYFDFFKKDVSGDIAILKLDSALNLGDNPHLSYLRLPFLVKKLDGSLAVTVGFGSNRRTYRPDLNANKIVETKEGDGKSYFLNTLVLTQQQCISLKNRKISDAQLCSKAFSNGIGVTSGTCYGDSGNPLVIDNTLIGVMSAGPRDCDETNSASVYTKVSRFLDLILTVLENRPNPNLKVKRFHTAT